MLIFTPLGYILLWSSSSSSVLLCSVHSLQINRLPSGGCDLREMSYCLLLSAVRPSNRLWQFSITLFTRLRARGRSPLTTFKSAWSGETRSLHGRASSGGHTWFIMSTVIPVGIGLRTRTTWRQLAWMLRCLWQGINRGYFKISQIWVAQVSGGFYVKFFVEHILFVWQLEAQLQKKTIFWQNHLFLNFTPSFWVIFFSENQIHTVLTD